MSNTTIQLKRRATGAAGAPASLKPGEVAVNEVDGIWYYGKGVGSDPALAAQVMAVGGAAKQDVAANLTALAGLTGVADRLPYFTGAGALALATFTNFGRTLLAAATAAAARTSLGAAASGANSDITSLTGLTTALSIAQGGTGAATAAAARSGLGAAASGANSDITSLTGLTTALSIDQGGTGGKTAAAARSALGIGTMGTQDAGAVAITGGNISGVTLDSIDGGTF